MIEGEIPAFLALCFGAEISPPSALIAWSISVRALCEFSSSGAAVGSLLAQFVLPPLRLKNEIIRLIVDINWAYFTLTQLMLAIRFQRPVSHQTAPRSR
jgi:hypothetical protein